MMHCTCERARREARAEAFAEAAEWLAVENDRLLDGHQPRDAVAYFTVLADEASSARHLESAGSPVRMEIVDCVEDDGYVTVHPSKTGPAGTEWEFTPIIPRYTNATGYPGEDGGLDG